MTALLDEAPPRRRVVLPPLHTGQQDVVASPARFKVLACGRRWGKTRLAAVLCVAKALEGGTAWWVAPTYTLAAEGWRVIKALVRQIPGSAVKETDRTVTFPGLTDGWVQVRSSDQEASLRGTGLDLAVMEEFAYAREESWTHEIRPALSDRHGSAMFISTPDGFNHFWTLFQRGDDPQYPEWASWQKPTLTNPYIDPQEIAQARRDLDEETFDQEYAASFVQRGSSVFRHVSELSTAGPRPFGHPQRDYVIGLDWGKVRDFTVISVWDVAARQQVFLDRFNQVDYTIQLTRVYSAIMHFRPLLILAEANSIGTPLIEHLQTKRFPVYPWTATAPAKKALIETYALGFERKALRLLNDPVQRAEHQAFRAEKLPSGLLRYRAPSGLHDDTVIAGALGYAACGLPRETDTHVLWGAERRSLRVS